MAKTQSKTVFTEQRRCHYFENAGLPGSTLRQFEQTIKYLMRHVLNVEYHFCAGAHRLSFRITFRHLPPNIIRHYGTQCSLGKKDYIIPVNLRLINYCEFGQLYKLIILLSGLSRRICRLVDRAARYSPSP